MEKLANPTLDSAFDYIESELREEWFRLENLHFGLRQLRTNHEMVLSEELADLHKSILENLLDGAYVKSRVCQLIQMMEENARKAYDSSLEVQRLCGSG